MTSVDLDRQAAPSLPPRRRENPAMLALAEGVRSVWSVGDLTLVLPAGTVVRCEGATPGVDARFKMRSAHALRRILTRGDVGVADG